MKINNNCSILNIKTNRITQLKKTNNGINYVGELRCLPIRKDIFKNQNNISFKCLDEPLIDPMDRY